MKSTLFCLRPGTPAALDGRLQVGDRIREVNGISLVNATRDEALLAFRNADDASCTLVIEPDAERIILSASCARAS